MKSEILKIAGMSCHHCVGAVRKELAKLPGVSIESVEIGSASIKYDETAITRDDIDRAISRAGYTLLAEKV